MRSSLRLSLLVLCSLTIALLLSAPASARVDRALEAPGTERAASSEAKAQASCGPCVIAAAVAVRGAIALRAARAAKALRVANEATRQAAKAADKISRAKIQRVQRDARVVSRRGKRWLKKNWKTLKPETKTCLSTIAFMESGKFLADQKIDKDEWSRYVVFGPRLVPATETLAINFPIRFDARELAGEAGEKIAECAVGIGFARRYAKGGNEYKPE